jgi:methylaspartate mutase sigma subunit
VGKQDWEEVEQKFKQMAFNRVYPPGISPKVVADELKLDLGIKDHG